MVSIRCLGASPSFFFFYPLWLTFVPPARRQGQLTISLRVSVRHSLRLALFPISWGRKGRGSVQYHLAADNRTFCNQFLCWRGTKCLAIQGLRGSPPQELNWEPKAPPLRITPFVQVSCITRRLVIRQLRYMSGSTGSRELYRMYLR